MRELRDLRKRLREALASVEAAVDRNGQAGACDEEICLPRGGRG